MSRDFGAVDGLNPGNGGGGGAEGGVGDAVEGREGARAPGSGGGALGGRAAEFSVVLRGLAIGGFVNGLGFGGGCCGIDCGGGLGGAPGGRGAELDGIRGADALDSGSDAYGESRSAPVSTAPLVFFSFGIPPAKRPPNCGASAMELIPPDVSLLLLNLFPSLIAAAAPGGLGTAGAPMTGPGEFLGLSSKGPDLSFVTAFFNLAPLRMSPRRAPYECVSD